jgi:cytochrome c5
MTGSKFFSKQNILKLSVIGVAFFAVTAFAYSSRLNRPERIEDSTINDETVANAPDPEKAKTAFNAAVNVFFSARCANCHPAGDIPTQGDGMSLHAQGVTRGKEGKGVYGMTCTTCHQAENLPGEHMPPGVPNWHMPPANQKMVFQGLTAGQLCRNLKDPKTNGGRKTPKDAIHHLEEDPLVHWAWTPGNGRTLPPMSYADFMKEMNAWVENGAACPE